jgi:tetratricopeptide (TPR) repeat protein
MKLSSLLRSFCLPIAAVAVTGVAQAQTPQKLSESQAAGSSSKADAYYHYSLGHVYAELAGAYGGKSEFISKAIENYRLAMKEDPGASFLADELSDLYIQSGKLRDAVLEAEEAIKQNPKDINSRRVLGRIYTRMIGGPNQSGVDEKMLAKAIEQYQKIVEQDPKDSDSWLTYGRLSKIAGNSVDAEKAYKKVLEYDPDSEDALTGLAMVYSDLGNSKAAADLLQKLASKNPSSRTLLALGSTYEQLREYALAAEAYKKALVVSPGNVDLKRSLAQNLMLADQLDEALKTYQEIVAEDKKDPESYIRMSQIYRQKKDMAKAREANEKAAAIDPSNLEVRYNEANLLESEGKMPQAIKVLKDMITATAKKTYTAREKNSRAMLLERLGFLYRSNDQTEEAVQTLRQIADVDPDLASRVAVQVIETYRIGRDYKKAAEEADAANKKFPNDRVIRSVRASLLADVGRGEEAVAETKKLIDGKDDREAYISLAQVYEKLKNYPEMAKAIDEAAKRSDSKEEKETIAFMRGAMYEKLKKFDQAEAEFRKVLEGNPASASALNYLGYMLADRGVRLQEAQQMISKALDTDPNNGAYLDSLGWVYYRMDKLPEAESHLRRAMERYSKDPTVHDHLGDVLFKQGKLKEAITQWELSLREWNQTPPSEHEPTEVAKVQKKLEGARVRLARETGVKQ